MPNSLPSLSLTKILDMNVNKNARYELPTLSSIQTAPTINQVGTPIIIKGHVFGLDSCQPLSFACIDIWQSSLDAQYDYHKADLNIIFPYRNELNTHGLSSNFDYRARLITDEQGRYEYETVKPSHYFDTIHSRWHCPHIHYYVQASGYKSLVTQIYFKDGEKNDIDPHIRESLTSS